VVLDWSAVVSDWSSVVVGSSVVVSVEFAVVTPRKRTPAIAKVVASMVNSPIAPIAEIRMPATAFVIIPTVRIDVVNMELARVSCSSPTIFGRAAFCAG